MSEDVRAFVWAFVIMGLCFVVGQALLPGCTRVAHGVFR
jgi:hypothetical protein